MDTKPIVSLLKADPFQPFVVRTLDGVSYTIRRRAELKVVVGGILYYLSPPTDPDTTVGSVTTFPATDVVSISVQSP